MRKVLVIHPERCTGCRSCEMVCSLIHDSQCNLILSRIGIVKTNGGGTHENIPVVCLQCHDPICVEVCAKRAIACDEATGSLTVNEAVGEDVRADLAGRGHTITPTERAIAAPVMLYIARTDSTCAGTFYIAGDPAARRHAAAIG